MQGEGTKTSSGRRKQSCPSKAALENSIDGKSGGNNKKLSNNDKSDISNSKAWTNNNDSKVSNNEI